MTKLTDFWDGYAVTVKLDKDDPSELCNIAAGRQATPYQSIAAIQTLARIGHMWHAEAHRMRKLLREARCG